ncbi:hypothetical protein RRG08_014284 [Elysia crispata]|uniref:Uncharacterized protein n=1 Tax=Elysia crispata TaxID=231223 RepID=A0AAE0Y0Z9_9GAST|nr:hypothetical protein RRG08_014284 [Elysia crispata]
MFVVTSSSNAMKIHNVGRPEKLHDVCLVLPLTLYIDKFPGRGLSGQSDLSGLGVHKLLIFLIIDFRGHLKKPSHSLRDSHATDD